MTHDPARQDYEPYYENPSEEYERLYLCLQQQIEDTFTTISRIQRICPVGKESTWKDLRSGLRIWRAAIRPMTGLEGK